MIKIPESHIGHWAAMALWEIDRMELHITLNPIQIHIYPKWLTWAAWCHAQHAYAMPLNDSKLTISLPPPVKKKKKWKSPIHPSIERWSSAPYIHVSISISRASNCAHNNHNNRRKINLSKMLENHFRFIWAFLDIRRCRVPFETCISRVRVHFDAQFSVFRCS